jgi:hypothetical protein
MSSNTLHHDRAAVIAAAIIQVVLSSSGALASELRHRIEAILRDEFADFQREAIADLRGQPE